LEKEIYKILTLRKETLGMTSHKVERLWCLISVRVKEDEMGRACSMNGREEECIWDICGKARRKETTGKAKM
jgi:hypothetical protein